METKLLTFVKLKRTKTVQYITVYQLKKLFLTTSKIVKLTSASQGKGLFEPTLKYKRPFLSFSLVTCFL